MRTRAPLAATALLVLCGCARPVLRELRVGLIYPMTGVLQSLSVNAREGAQLALDDLERNGGLVIGGVRHAVTLIERDGQVSPEAAMAAAKDLINRENVAVIIGPPLSSQAIPLGRLATSTGVPLVTQVATHPDVTRGTRNVWRVCFVDSFQGSVAARFALETLGARKAAILYDMTSPFPRDMAVVFRSSFESGGGVVVAAERFATGEVDFEGSLARIRDSGAEVLLLPNYQDDLIRIGEQIRAMGLTLSVLGSDAMRFDTPEDAALYEGAYVTAHFAPDSPAPATREFMARYRAAFGRDPADAGPLTYDALNLVIQAARAEAGVDAKAIARGLGNVAVYEGVTGTMRFDGSPDPRKSVVIALYRDGRLTWQRQVDP